MDPTARYRRSPDIVTFPLKYQKENSAQRWQRKIRQTRFIVQPDAQTCVEFIDARSFCRKPTAKVAVPSSCPSGRGGRRALVARTRYTVAGCLPVALWLGMLQRRRAARVGALLVIGRRVRTAVEGRSWGGDVRRADGLGRVGLVWRKHCGKRTCSGNRKETVSWASIEQST